MEFARMAEAPLKGIRVIDLGWLTAGAATSTLLLDLGADVVKVEGPGALDPFRNWVGAEAGRPWWDESPWFACWWKITAAACSTNGAWALPNSARNSPA
ncbi:MAG: hypothetical protein EBX37_13780 [Alphaproteobacteria bacterium]|nr:hypothetical protein [Alphaproteobacteria bacterium]